MKLELLAPNGRIYKPRPTQTAFHSSPATYRSYLGGYGSGKTLAGAVEAVVTMMEYPGSEGMVARYTFRGLETTSWKVFLGLIPPELIKVSTKNPLYVELMNGSYAHGWNLQTDQTMKSLNLSWFWFDEVCEDGIDTRAYFQAAGRRRNPIGPRKGWVTGNPAGKNWVWELFYSDRKKKDHEGFMASTAENIHLPPDYIAGLYELYDAEMVEKYLAGSFDVMEGLILDTFDTGLHVIDPFIVPPEWPRFRGMDHGLTNPTACVWVASDYDGNLFVYRNYYQRCSIPAENSKAILRLSEGESFDWTVIDPEVKKHDSTGQQIIDHYRQAGLLCQTGNNDVKASIALIRKLLQKDLEHKFPAQHPLKGEVGSPRLFITRDCKELIWELTQWKWKQVRPGGIDREMPLARHDHAIAALRYLLMRAPRQAVEAPSKSAYQRFIDLAAEMHGKPLIEPGIAALEDVIGNQGLR